MKVFLQRTWANYFLKPYLENHLKKPRKYFHDNLELVIYPGVFHPAYFFSTGVMMDFLKSINLKEKNFCEVGAGSGILSFLAYKRASRVCAIELSERAVKGLKENLERNFKDGKNFEIFHSDLFKSVPPQKFDVVMINPPWFFKEISDQSLLAWNCGPNGEYFVELFSRLPEYCKNDAEIFMILSENAEIKRIKDMAAAHRITMEVEKEVKIKWEKNYIFKLNIHYGAGSG